MRYTVKKRIRQIFGRCLRCGLTKKEVRAQLGGAMFKCGQIYMRHSWKMLS